jgi:hypothetical protein
VLYKWEKKPVQQQMIPLQVIEALREMQYHVDVIDQLKADYSLFRNWYRGLAYKPTKEAS